MSDKIYLGNRLADLDIGEPSLPVSKVILNVDSETYFASGDDTGLTIEQDCPWATQAMADSVLAKLKGFIYKPFSGTDALLDPAVELGDAITVGGTYGILAQMGRTLDRQAAASVGAPGTDEIEDEYPYKSKQRKQTDRILAKAYSRISKTAEEIRLEVQGLDNKYTAVSVTLDGLTVTDEEGTTRIKGSSVETDTLIVNAANISGKLTASQINADELVVKAANIDGQLEADQIVLKGSITWTDLSTAVQDEIDDAYSMAANAEDTVNSMTYTYGGKTYIDESMIMAGTIIAGSLQGGTVSILNAYEEEIGYISVGSSTSTGLELVSEGNLYFTSASCFIGLVDNTIRVSCAYFAPQGTAAYLGHSSYGMWEAVYAYTSTIQTSDRNLKNSIEELDERYLKFILWLVPRRYKMNNGTSDRYHVGFIAQDVLEGMELFGITDLEFAGFIRDVDADGNEILMLRYEEFIGLLTLALQNHEERILKLEAAV